VRFLDDVCQLVSDLIRGHVRQTITAATTTAYLGGSPGRRLQLPETPVTAVLSVVQDGTPLDPASYSWRRNGALWLRTGAWGNGAESEVVVTYSHGWTVVPGDLHAVALAAAARLAPNIAQVEYEADGAGYAVRGSFSRFTLHETIVLRRYRRQAAAL